MFKMTILILIIIIAFIGNEMLNYITKWRALNSNNNQHDNELRININISSVKEL